MEVVETIKEESRDIFLRLQFSKLSRELVVVQARELVVVQARLVKCLADPWEIPRCNVADKCADLDACGHGD
jgi:hypothetical protein